MEAEATNALLRVVAVRDGVHVVARGDGLVEGRVERSDLQRVAENLATAVNDKQRAGIVQRSQVRVALHALDHMLIHRHRAAKLGSGMRHTVADGVDLRQARQDAARTRDAIEHDLKGVHAACGTDKLGGLLTAGALVHDKAGALAAHAFHKPARELVRSDFLPIGPFRIGEQLELERARPCVKDQYVHGCSPPCGRRLRYATRP